MSKMVVCPYGKEARILPMQNITKQEVYDECYKMQRKLKALEIIKKKKVCIVWLKNGLSSYNSTIAIYELPRLTQEEYDLLKEVLFND